MEGRRILVCDSDQETLTQVKEGLQNEGYDTNILTDAKMLLSEAKRFEPRVILVNPDISGFNEHDVCTTLMQKMQIPVILLIDRNSTHRESIGACRADDAVTKPVKLDVLTNLVAKHYSIHQ